MSNELMQIVQGMQRVYGLDISNYDEAFLKQTLKKRYASAKVKKISDYSQYLLNNIHEAEILQHSLNITYTEFFRSPLTFAHLEQWILPSLIQKKTETEELRIWSAGCSSGQEAYSIAMLIESIYANKRKGHRYRIIATDICESALHEAQKGEYSASAVQNVRLKDLDQFFEKSEGRYAICDRIKKNVNFSIYDLLDSGSSYPQESIFGHFDLVVCSNMLFYYNHKHQQHIIKKLVNSMAECGYLITGEAERQLVDQLSNLHRVVPPSPIFKKDRGGV